jgi:hypothetical protein
LGAFAICAPRELRCKVIQYQRPCRSVTLSYRRADNPWGANVRSLRSIHPSCLCGLDAFRRTPLPYRIGKLDACHPEALDHNSRHPKAQSLLLRITNETSQGLHISFHRHQLISRPLYGFQAMTPQLVHTIRRTGPRIASNAYAATCSCDYGFRRAVPDAAARREHSIVLATNARTAQSTCPY